MPYSASRLEFTGSGEQAAFHVLLPEGWQGVSVQVNGTDCPFLVVGEDQSRYIDFAAAVGAVGVGKAVVNCRLD